MDYPVTFTVDFPERSLNRLTTFFRLFTAIPILAVVSVLGEITAIATALLLLFRRKYPRWWFDWNRELFRFQNRIGVYVALIEDRYPSTDEQQAVHLEFPYPDAERELNRWLPLVKWLLAIPHYVVLAFLYIGVLFSVLIAWFAILFTGRYPRSLFRFVEGTIRWTNRVAGYAFLLVTDRYPPFRLSA